MQKESFFEIYYDNLMDQLNAKIHEKSPALKKKNHKTQKMISKITK